MRKLALIQDLLRHQGLAGWLLYDFRGLNPIARRLAPLPPHALLTRRWAYWIPARGEPGWLVHAIEAGAFADQAARVVTYSSWQSLAAALLRLTDGPQVIACEYSPDGSIPYVSYVDAGTLERWRRLGYEPVSSADLIQAVYATWSPEQLAGHRRAAATCLAVKDEAFAWIAQRLRRGQTVTEGEVQAFIHERLTAAGLEPEHPPIVAVNAHAGDPHYSPHPERPTPIRPGDLILIDLWGREAGNPEAVFADITWMGYAGPEPPAALVAVFDVVARARDAAVALVQTRVAAGAAVAGWEVDDAARRVIVAAGYGPDFPHRTGHSLDTSIHGAGVNMDNLETHDTRRLIPGIGFTIEPGIYRPDFGIRLEIDMFIHPDHAEVTTLPLQTAFLTMDV
jgi:Xaa-Pro aminopeptidase